MLECSMLRYITCTLLPVDFLSLAPSLPSLPPRFPSAQTRKSNSKLTKRTFILSPLANCHLFADWNFLLLVGFRDKRLKKKNCASYNCNSYYFPCEWNPLPCEITLAEYCYSLENSRGFRHAAIAAAFVYEQFSIRDVEGEGKGYALFQRYFKTMPCSGQVIIPLSATATPHVDLHNHHGLPYRALWP